MNCDDVFEALTDPALSQSAELERHLANCPRCRQLQQVLEPARSLLCGDLPAERVPAARIAERNPRCRLANAPFVGRGGRTGGSNRRATRVVERRQKRAVPAALRETPGLRRGPAQCGAGPVWCIGRVLHGPARSGFRFAVAAGRYSRLGAGQYLHPDGLAAKGPGSPKRATRHPLLRGLSLERPSAAATAGFHVVILAAPTRGCPLQAGQWRRARLDPYQKCEVRSPHADFLTCACPEAAELGARGTTRFAGRVPRSGIRARGEGTYTLRMFCKVCRAREVHDCDPRQIPQIPISFPISGTRLAADRRFRYFSPPMNVGVVRSSEERIVFRVVSPRRLTRF